ncbi:MAG: T9SS type A sorting domain-containing protein [Lentimicrobiaceae bacterium]|jgi:hypothetical protein|nr:T9SS type A sorting domain-containing protein [Lentimicrobiaceae bacterium]
MKKKYSILIIFTFLGLFLNAQEKGNIELSDSTSEEQEWFNNHSEWTYWMPSIASEWVYPYTMSVLSDTIIAGHHCKKTNFGASCPNASEGNTSLFFYASNDRVLFWDPVIAEFKLLYDFTKQAGESYQIYPLMGSFSDILTVFIDSVRIIHIDDKPIRVQYVTTNSEGYRNNHWEIGKMGNATIIEYIGSMTYFYPQESGYCDMNFSELCIFSDENMTYKVDEKDCSRPYIAAIDEFLYHLVSIYPNPTTDVITIDVSVDCNLKIFNPIGVCVGFLKLHENQPQTISLSNFQKGIYILQFESKKHNFNRKILKI